MFHRSSRGVAVLFGAFSLIAAGALVANVAYAAGNLRGRVIGFEKLLPDVYVEAAKTDAHRYTWREPSGTVRAEFRALAATPSRDICIVATSSSSPPAMPPVLVRITGGRSAQTTIVVTPGTKLVFENRDPFVHRLVHKDLKIELNGGAKNEWTAPGQGRYEFRDELFPSVRLFVVVEPQAVATVFPGRDGAYAFPGLTSGEYTIKAFFQGKQVGKSVNVMVKDKLPTDIKDPLNVGEGAEAK